MIHTPLTTEMVWNPLINQVPEALQRPTKKRNRKISDKKDPKASVWCLKRLKCLHTRSLRACPLKNGGWKTILPYWGPVTFQGPMLNFGRVFRRFHRVEKIPRNAESEFSTLQVQGRWLVLCVGISRWNFWDFAGPAPMWARAKQGDPPVLLVN